MNDLVSDRSDPAEFARAAVEEMIQQYAKKPDDGKNPVGRRCLKQMLKTPEGKNAIANMLASMVHGEFSMQEERAEAVHKVVPHTSGTKKFLYSTAFASIIAASATGIFTTRPLVGKVTDPVLATLRQETVKSRNPKEQAEFTKRANSLTTARNYIILITQFFLEGLLTATVVSAWRFFHRDKRNFNRAVDEIGNELEKALQRAADSPFEAIPDTPVLSREAAERTFNFICRDTALESKAARDFLRGLVTEGKKEEAIDLLCGYADISHLNTVTGRKDRRAALKDIWDMAVAAGGCAFFFSGGFMAALGYSNYKVHLAKVATDHPKLRQMHKDLATNDLYLVALGAVMSLSGGGVGISTLLRLANEADTKKREFVSAAQEFAAAFGRDIEKLRETQPDLTAGNGSRGAAGR